MPQATGTKTAADVISWVTQQFGDVASVQIDSAKIISWINMAVLEIVGRDSKAYQGRFTMPSVANQQEYTYPAALMTPMLVKWGDDVVLQPVAFEMIQEQTGSEWVNTKGDPQFYSHQAGFFQLWPTPTSVKTITIYGSAQPSLITTSADLLPLPDRFFPRICTYCMAKAQELDEDFQAAAENMTDFESQLKLSQNSEDNMSTGQYPIRDDPDEYWYYNE